MSSKRIHGRLGADDVLATVVTGLEVLQATSEVVLNVPYLSAVVSSALGLARTVQKVKGDRERYVRLARRAAELSTHIEQSIHSDGDVIDPTLSVQLVLIRGVIAEIERAVEIHLRQSPLKRFLNQSSITAALDDFIDKLDSAWRTFDTASLIALRTKMERQAVYDDHSQLRLFRWSDLKCLKVRGKYRIGSQDVGQEWEGKWDGRIVVVRTIKTQPRTVQCDYSSLVTYYPNLHHPYVRQVIGYSHPALSDRFYVMETGNMLLMHQFRGQDMLSRLRLWLQHVVDYQDAFHYVEGLGIPTSEVCEVNFHNRCLSSLMLNEEGRLVIDASDFVDSNLGCFQSCLRTLYDEENGNLSPGQDYADDDDISPHASALLTALRSNTFSQTKALDVEPFIGSDLAKIWASHQFQSNVDARWGDYGYIQRNPDASETFIRLGHIYDIVNPTGKISTFLLQRMTDCEWRPAIDYPWPSQATCHSFDLEDPHNRIEDIAVVRTIPDDCEYHDFFWNHGETIARDHGIALHDVVLFEETFHYACSPLQPQTDHETEEDPIVTHNIPPKIYFHQFPLMASGEAPTPWGYWSLDSKTVPGPWPLLQVPGVDLSCSVRSNYARVSTFEAEILVYMNTLRRRRDGHI